MLTTQQLRSDLELVDHRSRMRRMVQLGRSAHGGDSEATRIVHELGTSSSAYDRMLALQSCYGSRDGVRAAAALGDASRTVRYLAVGIVATTCDDSAVVRALQSVDSARLKHRLLAYMQRCSRRAAVNAFFDDPAAFECVANVDLLPLGTRELVLREVERFREHASPIGWARLATHHPDIAASEVERVVTVGLDPRTRSRIRPILTRTARGAPDIVLPIVARLSAADEPLAVGMLNELLQKRPRETFDVLRARDERGVTRERPPGAFAGLKLARVLHRLGPERIAYAITRAYPTLPEGRRGRRWFLRLSAEDRAAALHTFLHAGNHGAWGAFLLRHVAVAAPEREAAFQRFTQAARDKHGAIPERRLADLPRDLREREGLRHLNDVVEYQGRPDRLAWAELLPFAKARDALMPFLGHPEGDVRARAMRALVRTLEGDRGSVKDVLAFIASRRFEQDPVRLAAINALAEQPWACFPPEVLPAVGEIAEAALAASDLSTSTAAYLERLIVRLFRVDPAWGAEWLQKVVRVRGTLGQAGLGENLLPVDMPRFEAAFTKLVDVWLTRERVASLLWVASSLGQRLELAPSLMLALELIASEPGFSQHAAAALALLRQADASRFDALVQKLLAADASFVRLPVVASHVSCFRQNQLADLLSDKPMQGRFATGRTHWVVDFVCGFATWTAQSQDQYAASLAALATDPERDVPTLRFALDRLGELPYADATPVLAFASDPRQPVREIAIDVAGRLDAAQGVPTLVACLDDARARWAIYALRRALTEMRRSHAVTLLRAVKTEKITVAKEVVRLLGELGGDEGFAALLGYDVPTTKRDVRIALLRALWDHLHRPEAWAAFENATRDPDWIVAVRIADVPTARLSADGDERLAELLARVLDRPEPEARVDLLPRMGFLPLRDTERHLFRAVVRRIGSEAPTEARTATFAARAMLFRLGTATDEEVDLVAKEIEGAIARRTTAPAVLEGLKLATHEPESGKRLGKRVLAALHADVHAVPQRIAYAAHTHDAPALARLFVSLDQKGLLHVDAMNAAFAVIDGCAVPADIESALRASPSASLRRLALHALCKESSVRGWSKSRVAHLHAYRADADVGVAGAAQWVFPK